MATEGSCCSRWCWRSDHSGKSPNPGGTQRDRTERQIKGMEGLKDSTVRKQTDTFSLLSY